MRGLRHPYRWGRDHPLVVDLAFALVIASFGILTDLLASEPRDAYVRDPDVLSVVLTVAGTLPLALRRRYTIPTYVVIMASAAAYYTRDYAGGGPMVGLLIGLYGVAAHCGRRVAAWTLALTLVLQIGATSIDPSEEDTVFSIIALAALLTAAWVIGDNIRVRRAYVTAVEDRAAQLEREQDAQARRAVLEERSRIARELHDIVAHSMSVMVVQAGAARRTIDRDPGRAVEAISQIETTGRDALAEMRRVVTVLRSDGDRDRPSPPTPMPASPGLPGLPGSSGAIALTGSPASSGSTGTTGSPASSGSSGTTGSPASSGSSGTTGATASSGSSGSSGLTGTSGPTGPTGATGEGAEPAHGGEGGHDGRAGREAGPEGSGPLDRDALLPQPRLDELPSLVEQCREAGLPVEVQIAGDQRPLPSGVELAVFRIVQEALTNTMRHAGPARAQVELRFGAEAVTVSVVDDGRGAAAASTPDASPGHGLTGMNERVALYGGHVAAGPRPGGGFAVRAEIPLPEEARTAKRPAGPSRMLSGWWAS
jgi:signal transduction histidine kinase